MKTTLTAIAIIIAATQAQAFTADQVKRCSALGDLAQTIMQRRQEGVSISKLLSVSDEPFIQTMVINAYDIPQMRTDANRADQANRYREQYETACFRFLGEPA
jgi:hypothetical protein